MKTLSWLREPITKSGIYADVPINDYHSGNICDGASVSSSDLRRLFSLSPAHFYAEWPGNPNRIEPEDKAHFIMGRAVHHLFLGEKFFSKLFCIEPEEYPDRNTGLLKKWTYNRSTASAGASVSGSRGYRSLRQKISTISVAWRIRSHSIPSF